METISSAIPKARKEHKCDWCSGVIKKGEIYESHFLKEDEGTYTWKNHTRCTAIAAKLDMLDHWDGLDEEAFREYINNEHWKLQKTNKPIPFLDKLDFVCRYHLIS